MLLGKSLQDACYFGNALGAMVVGQQGATQPLQQKKLNQLLANIEFGKVDDRFSHLMK
jgi:sugar/nucleoside kinase (ribokinase family)